MCHVLFAENASPSLCVYPSRTCSYVCVCVCVCVCVKMGHGKQRLELRKHGLALPDTYDTS